MVFQFPLVIKYDNNGKPVGLAESNEVSVSSVSATTLVVDAIITDSLSAASSNVTADLDEFAFVVDTTNYSGSPLTSKKIVLFAPSSTGLPPVPPAVGTPLTLASDGSSFELTDTVATINNLGTHLGSFAGVNGNNIHWHLSTLNSYFVNTSGDTMTGNLNTPSVSANYFDFNLTAVTTAAEGRLRWSDAYKTFLIGGPSAIEMAAGQEVSIRVRNMTGSSMPKGSVVYVSGFNSNLPTVALASASSEAQTHKGLGVLKQALGDGDRGLMTVYGLIEDIDLGTYPVGNILYLSLTPGLFTSSYAPAKSHPELIGTVIQNGANGVLFVHIQHGYELNEIHDVSRLSASEGQTLVWNSTSSIYEHKHIYNTLAFTIDNPSSITYKTLFYAKNMLAISEVHSVIAGASPSSVGWTLYLASDVTDPEAGTLLVTDTTSSTTTGGTVSGTSLSEGWVVLAVDSTNGSVSDLHLTIQTY
jgi:hypothetical protein